uniref:Uncharacterized protein n=1 Tax=Oryza barthii TaxID=65489 RepID=A0A0D3GLS0_9ORYZ
MTDFVEKKVVYRSIALMQRWRVLQRRKDCTLLDDVVKKLMEKMVKVQLRPGDAQQDDLGIG